MANEEDIDAMAEFWSDNSGWDVIDRNEWKRRFVNTAFGQAVVALGLDEETNKIIGQFIFIPTNISVKGKEIIAYRPFAPVLQKTLQTKFGITSLLTGQHPLLKMYKIVWERLAKQGTTLIYILPDPRWSRVLQAFPFIMTHRFSLWSRFLTDSDNTAIGDNITILKITPSDPAIDLLWQQAASVYSCSIVRNSQSLPWKTSHGNYQVCLVKKNIETVGLFVYIYKQRDDQWLICDMIVKDTADSLYITLNAACNTIEQENGKNGVNGKIAILATSVIEEIIRQIGFQKENYQFTLAVHVLNKDQIDNNDVSPANWYISAND